MKFQAFASIIAPVVAAALVGMIALVPTTAPRAAEHHRAHAMHHHAVRMRAHRVDAQIARLRHRLHITKAQMPQWRALARVMRENARLIRLSRADRAKIHPTDAIDGLYAARRQAQAEIKRLERVIPVAEALYAVLTKKQKAEANILFTRPANRNAALLNTRE